MSDDFLTKAAEEEKGKVDMAGLEDLSSQLVQLRAKITEKELELANLKTQETKLNKETFPQFMLRYGLRELKLASGSTISIKKDVYARIPKEPARRKEAIAWLKEHGGEEIVKEALTVDDPDEALLKVIQDMGVFYSVDQEVNTNSLLAFLREALGLKKGTLARVSIEDVSPALGLYISYETKIGDK